MADILKENPAVALLPLVESIFTQLKGVKKRREWVREKTTIFGPLGPAHCVVDVLSIWISYAIAAAAILSSLAFLATNGFLGKTENEVASYILVNQTEAMYKDNYHDRKIPPADAS